MSDFDNISLQDYVDSFANDSAAARSLDISPQRLYFNLLKADDYFIQVSDTELRLCRVVSVSENRE